MIRTNCDLLDPVEKAAPTKWVQNEIQMQARMMEYVIVLLIFAVMAQLIQESILKVQWAHKVNISWTTEASILFPQDVMSCATWHRYRL